jgi:hypothetical protein
MATETGCSSFLLVPKVVSITRVKSSSCIAFWLSAVEDGFDDVRGEERQAEQAVDEAAGDTLCFGQFPS